MSESYLNPGPQREEIDATQGSVILEFGTDWCGHCQAAAPLLKEVIIDFPNVKLIKIEDGPGRRLGRTFRVKLWPTFIFIKDGIEQARLVRPQSISEISEVLLSKMKII